MQPRLAEGDGLAGHLLGQELALVFGVMCVLGTLRSPQTFQSCDFQAPSLVAWHRWIAGTKTNALWEVYGGVSNLT